MKRISIEVQSLYSKGNSLVKYLHRNSSFEEDYSTIIYSINPSISVHIENSISPKMKEEYDLKVVEFIVETLKELNNAGKVRS